MKKIDTHMLIGLDRSGKKGTIEEYMQLTQGRYKVVGAMSVVSPGYAKDGGIYYPCVWEETNEGIVSKSVFQRSDGERVHGNVPENPYAEANEITRRELEAAAKRYPGTQFLHYPLLHLTRDTSEHLDKVLGENRVVKVHGIGSALGPEDIPEEVGKLMGRHENIVLPHTDYFIGNPETALQYLQRKNDPAKWMDFFERYSIRGLIAHGARLCKDTLARVKRNAGQFVVEAGPMIDGRCQRIKTKTDDYVGSLIDMVGPEHLVFNTDYPFMEEGEDLEADLRARLSEKDYQRAMYENARRFLRFDDSRYLRGNLVR